MCLFKKQRAVSSVDSETRFKGDAQLPDHPKLIRVQASNDTFFYRLYGDLATADCEIVVESPCNVIIVRDGIASEVLKPGRYPLFQTVEVGKVIKHKEKALTAISIYVFNPSLAYSSLWGTPAPIQYRDPETDEPVSFRANGQFDIRVEDVQKFYNSLIGSNQKFTVADFTERIIITMASYFKKAVVDVILEKHINYIDLQRYELDIADESKARIDKLLLDEYGLRVPVFAIKELVISAEERARVEALLKQERVEGKAKKDAKEIAAELERLADKEYEREMALDRLDREDHAKYLEVLKILGWPDKKDAKEGSHFCSKCGAAVAVGDEFCPNCGAELNTNKQRNCPKCGKVVKGKAKFCPHCGAELK